MTKLSVNINKIATIRNARGGNNPNLVQVAIDCQSFGADGITIHPRPDERHITAQDVYNLKPIITTEYNIEGFPDDRFFKLASDTKPEQVTLVPDGPDVLTSNAGWDTIRNKEFLQAEVERLKSTGARVSLFIDPIEEMIEGAKAVGADRIELYTEGYAVEFAKGNTDAVKPYAQAAEYAHKLGLKVNAGHDLDLKNLKFFAQNVPHLDEVSIGHALVCDALYLGLENTIRMYQKRLMK